MREIKFDIVARNVAFGEIHHEVYTLEQLWYQKHISTWLKSHNAKIIAKRQYTGLKDKDGVEIYEGDIIALKSASGGVMTRKIVEWREVVNFIGWNIGKNGSATSKEVIGNIYESPELLEKAS